MKLFFLVISLFCSIACSQAATGYWPDTQEPPISLDKALVIAKKSLHKRAKDFYFVNASLIKSRSVKGEWWIKFGSKSGEIRTVIVTFDNKVYISKGVPATS